MSLQDLLNRKEGFIKSARTAALAGKVTEAKQFREKAELAQAAITEFEATEALAAIQPTSVKSAPPPPLPVPVPMQPSGNPQMTQAQAAYVTRFGTIDSSIKAILTDLHGQNHEQLYHAQRRAFKSYLRTGREGLDAESYALLKQIVLTPEAVKSAIMQGTDDVNLIKSTMVEAIGTLGGFAVPVDFQTRIIERIRAEAVVRRRASVNQTSRDTVEIPVGTGGTDQYSSAVRVTWVDETPVAGTAETNLTFGMESIPVHTVMAETPLSRNMVEDAVFDIEGYLVEKFTEAAEIDEDNRFIIGSGIGSPQGILPGGTNLLGLTAVNSGSSSALTWAGLIRMSYALPERYRRNAVWVAKRSTYAEIRLLQNSSGQYLWAPDQYKGGEEHNPNMLLGYPVVEQESMPAVGAGAYPLAFGDFKGYSVFDRIGMTVERFLDSSTARQNQIMYVMRRRLGGQPTETWRFATQLIST